MSDRTEQARAEAERRYPNPPPQENHDRAMVAQVHARGAFRAGVEWADANPQPHTITTSEEMDALPLGAVILSDKGHAWQKVHHRAGFTFTGGWLCADPIYPGIYNDPDMQKGAIFYDGPATVLHLPEATDDE